MDSETLNEQWARICAQVKSYQDIDPSQVSAFFSRLVPQAMSYSFLMLTADNDFIKTWVEQHYTEVIVRALRDLTGVVFAVAIAVDPTQEQRKIAAAGQPSPAAPLSAPAQPMPTPTPAQPAASTMESLPSQPIAAAAPPSPAYGAPLSQATPFEPSGMVAHSLAEDVVVDHYAPPAPAPLSQEPVAERASNPSSSLTFENFVIGESNRMAYSMAVEVAESPGRLPLNPLFIYGKSGLGKTHLMRAIQNYIEETRPSMRTVYVDAQDFVSKYSEAGAIKDQEKVSFRNFRAYYEQADILLLDDVQHLQGKKESMNMLFQLFNTLTSQGKQVVLSADRAPKNIQFDERLKSRFYSGGTIDIQPPEVETKLGIVKSFTDEFSRSEGLGNFTLSDDIQMYIAENSGSNIRELKGAVNTVIYRMIYCDRSDISIDEVRELLANHFTGGMSRSLTVEDIQREVENFFKVSHSDMVGPKRSQSIVRPRQIAIYLCRQLLDLPYGDIGKKFNRDHSTAIHSATSIEERLKTDRDTQEEIEVLQKIICELD
ncbi:chromosomal replication initiator protein DnaA [Adlercreutzia equolifaciens]|uniref:chromosomal replication initiator protein DnaA n=1 Tax=Adlercreutzia TaxID=447020 RepID=UPI001D08D9BB|nr:MULTISPECIES: chromosomal replication initiator protein DnaA [Adlercreutzia]MCB6761496.1 chromosomal replication initiator protein DnaA [Adlercreutzia equolifaciens]MCB6977222.1 chromosomal replication initiator protein DnaA [Adlercreutzia equolifaciens]MCQ5071694.1 chromosomal replication initiator protein DnaA [Adlercreutzia sp. DFI.6.23]MDE8685205.1 chromosomal replication initiator protein DnaA [Adlercreutzia rubneri]